MVLLMIYRGNITVYTIDMNKKMKKQTSFKAYRSLLTPSHSGPAWRLDWSDYKVGSLIATCGLDKEVG